tara:strand:+ start:358 stop:552 length:195 start_codon:yes stop_codon:yes gene_type:complete
MKQVFDGGDIQEMIIKTNKKTEKVQIHLILNIDDVPESDIKKLITMSKRKLEMVTLVTENIQAM